MKKLLLILLCLSPCLISAKYAPTCFASPQAGVQTVILEDDHQPYTFTFPHEFCTPPVLVLTGDEMVNMIKIGFVTPAAAGVVIEGEAGEVNLYWQAMLPTP